MVYQKNAKMATKIIDINDENEEYGGSVAQFILGR
jgi:hypothetical protein